jgi:hypothetical protein
MNKILETVPCFSLKKKPTTFWRLQCICLEVEEGRDRNSTDGSIKKISLKP